MTNTPNKGYNLQGTGTNSGTWGIVLNSIFSTIDNNLGGTLSLSVAGAANVTLTLAQAQNLIYNFTGVLTGNINVIFPAAGGLYFINNKTTGNFTLTIQAGTSVSGFLVPQGTQAPIYVDNSSSPPTVGGASGTQYIFTAGTIGGTANAITTSTTFPSNFALNNGTLFTIIPTSSNTGATTLNVNGTGAIAINKVGATGLIAVQNGDIVSGVPYILQYNGSVWVALNIVYTAAPTQIGTNFSLSFAYWLQPTIATAAITITVPQVSANFTYYFNLPVTAGGGAIVWTPYSTDVIWVNGTSLGAGVSYTQPKGSTAFLTTDANGNIYLNVDNANLSSAYATAQYGPTAASGTNTTQLATTAFAAALHGKLLNVQTITATGTYTPTAGTNNAIVILQGPGGGGGGCGSSGATGGGQSTASTFGAILTANAGGGGNPANGGGNVPTANAAGTATGGTFNATGSVGFNGYGQVSSNNNGGPPGAPGIFGTGAGSGGAPSGAGAAAAANTGAGGGASGAVASVCNSGASGSAGGLSIYYYTSVASQTVTLPAGGTAGGAGVSGFAGGAGAKGVCIIMEFS